MTLFRDQWLKSFNTIRGTLVLVLCLAACTGILYFVHFHDFYTPDSTTYVLPAYHLLNGRGFTGLKGSPETIRTPGYPLLIWGFLVTGLGLKALIVFQHVLRVLIILATCIYTFQLSGSRMQALLCGIVLSLDLPLLEESNFILTEILFLTILMIILWRLWQERLYKENSLFRSAVTGLLAGISVLIRPAAILFFVPAGIYLVLLHKPRSIRTLMVFLLAFCCAPVLWASRNYYQTGYFTVTSISGIDVLDFRAAGVLAINDPGKFDAAIEKRQSQLEQEACKVLQDTYGVDCTNLSDPLKSRYFSSMGARIVLQHPIAYLKLAARGVGYILLDGDAPRFSLITGLSPRFSVRVLLLYTVPLLALAITGLANFWKANRSFFYLALLVCAYFVLITAGAEGSYRYRVPITPVYAILATSGIDFCMKRFFRCFARIPNKRAQARTD